MTSKLLLLAANEGKNRREIVGEQCSMLMVINGVTRQRATTTKIMI